MKPTNKLTNKQLVACYLNLNYTISEICKKTGLKEKEVCKYIDEIEEFKSKALTFLQEKYRK